MLNKIITYCNFHIQGIGFQSINDFADSTFHTNSLKSTMTISAIFGTIAFFIERYLGITPLVYITFLMLIAGEFWTGIRASHKMGKKLQSRKFGRMIVKMSIYSLIIGGLFSFANGLKVPEIPFIKMKVNIYEWIYYTVLNLIIIQLIISLFENLSELGYEESSKIFRVIKKALGKWLEFKNED